MTTCFQSGETFPKGCERGSSGVSLSSHGTAQCVRALLVRQRAFSTCTTFEPLKTFKRFLSRHRNPFTCIGILIRHIFLSTASTLTTFLTSPHLFSYPISLRIFLSPFFRLEEISMFRCVLIQTISSHTVFLYHTQARTSPWDNRKVILSWSCC